jgi:hypothetical protein
MTARQTSFGFGKPRHVRGRPSLGAVEFASAEFREPRFGEDDCRLCRIAPGYPPDPDCDGCKGTGVFNP